MRRPASASTLAFAPPPNYRSASSRQRGTPDAAFSNAFIFHQRINPPETQPYSTSTSTALTALPSFRSCLSRLLPGTLIASDAVAATLFVSGLLLGYIFGRRKKRKREKLIPTLNNNYVSEQFQNGVTPDYLNYAIAKLWTLFQRNTKQFAMAAIQPVLDETDKPDFVKAIRLKQYTVGNQAPQIDNLQPVPARSSTQLECSFDLHFESTSDLVFEVDCYLPHQLGGNTTIAVPVSLSNLQVDAKLWSSFALTPYEPYCTAWNYSVLETPQVQFDMNVASALPITDVPGLRSLFFRLIQHEVPKDFLFPRSNQVQFQPPMVQKAREKVQDWNVTQLEEAADSPEEDVRLEVQQAYPQEWALYQSFFGPPNNKNATQGEKQRVSLEDFVEGLQNWGYSETTAKEYFEKLDLNGHDTVSFGEFCRVWPNVTAELIPDDYEGMLSLRLKRVANLTQPVLGWSDPVLEIGLGNCSTTQTFAIDSEHNATHGDPIVLDQALELTCRPPSNETLEIRLLETSHTALRKRGGVIAVGKYPLESLAKSPQQSIQLHLEPQGVLELDLSFAKFADRWDVRLVEQEDDSSGKEDKDSTTKILTLAAEELKQGLHSDKAQTIVNLAVGINDGDNTKDDNKGTDAQCHDKSNHNVTHDSNAEKILDSSGNQVLTETGWIKHDDA